MSGIFLIFLFIGGIFGSLGALMAGLITYNEYMHHFAEDSKEPLKMALQTGFLTFIFFIALCLLLGFVFTEIKF